MSDSCIFLEGKNKEIRDNGDGVQDFSNNISNVFEVTRNTLKPLKNKNLNYFVRLP